MQVYHLTQTYKLINIVPKSSNHFNELLFLLFRRRLTSGLANMAPHKRGSMDSLDELGSGSDNEIIDDEVMSERT